MHRISKILDLATFLKVYVRLRVKNTVAAGRTMRKVEAISAIKTEQTFSTELVWAVWLINLPGVLLLKNTIARQVM